MRSRIAIAAAVIATLFIAPAAAQACTCASTGDAVDDAELILEESDAAFIGRLVSVKRVGGGDIPDVPDSSVIADYRYRVGRDFIRDLGRFVKVRSIVAEASCGLPAEKGSRYALGISSRRDGGWTSNLCGLTEPKALRKAAAGADVDRGAGGGCAPSA